jgi:hypothetical protein
MTVDVYFFDDKKKIDLNAIDNDALIFIDAPDAPERVEILAVKNKQYYTLILPTLQEREKIGEEWSEVLREKPTFIDHKLVIPEKDFIIALSIDIIMGMLNFPYTRIGIDISEDGTSIHIPKEEEGEGELQPILKANAGRTLSGFEAINFIRQSKEELAQGQSFMGYRRTGKHYGSEYLALNPILQSVTPSFKNLCTEINTITKRFSKSPLTESKKEVLTDFTNYCCWHLDENTSKADLIENWVASYKKTHGDENPFTILMQQRRTGILSIFNPKLTDSIKLFKKFLEKEPLPNSLKEIVKGTPAPHPK